MDDKIFQIMDKYVFEQSVLDIKIPSQNNGK